MTIVVVPKFDFVNFLESIKKHRATHLLYDSTFPYALASRKLFCFFLGAGLSPLWSYCCARFESCPSSQWQVIAQLTLQHPATKKYDLTHVRLLFCGAAPLSAALIEAITRILPRAVIGQGYGSFPRL